MIGERKNSLRGIAVVTLLLTLILSLSLSGCEGGSSTSSRSTEPSPKSESYDYTNEEFGFAAQFPAKPSEETFPSLYEDLNFYTTSFYGRVSNELDYGTQLHTFVHVTEFTDPSNPKHLSDLTDEGRREWMLAELSSSASEASGEKASNPAADFEDRNGYPSATTVFSATHSGQVMWHYATVVFTDNTIYSLGGTRETEGEAIAAEASFRLLASPEVPQTPDYSDTPQPTEPQIPSGAINWTEAGQHIGETVTVYGTVAGSTYASTSNGQPTFINIGVDYPDTSRVSVVVWGEDRRNFPEAPESMYLGKTICVTGEVYIYSGACNIKVQSSSQIQVME